MAEPRGDQAAGLRRLLAFREQRVYAFTAGCPGVGRSVAIANLAAALAERGSKVLIVDEDCQTDEEQGIAALFGLIGERRALQAGEVTRPGGREICPLAPGITLLPAVDRPARNVGGADDVPPLSWLDALRNAAGSVDFVLVDVSLDHPLGLSPLALAAQETVVVVAPDVAVITEAYSLIKRASLGHACRNFRLLVTQARVASEAQAIYDNMAQVTRSRGLARLTYAGHIPADDRLRQATRLAQPVGALFPEAPAAQAFRALGEALLDEPVRDGEQGVEHFVQQLIHLRHRSKPAAIFA